MKKYVAFIILIGIVLATVLGYGIMQIINARTKIFTESGFILQSLEEDQNKKVERYYFGANEPYKATYNDNISFNDINGDRVIASATNFIHYTNGSISALTNGVIIDLNQIDTDPITYYSIAKEKKVKKAGDQYIVYNLNKELQFENFIWKISDQKFLVVGSPMKLVFDDGTEKVIDGFVEIEYVDNEVVKIYNQEVTYKTVSSKVYLEMPDGIKINLATRIVNKDGANKMSLYNMVIDLNDNVPLVDLETKLEQEDKDNEDTNETENSTTGGSTSNSQTNNNESSSSIGSAVDGNGSSAKESVVKETPTIVAPVYKVENFEVSTIGVDLNIVIEDPGSLLASDSVIKVINNSTGKIIDTKTEDHGLYHISYNTSALEPDTEYTILIESSYIVDGVVYNKNFVYKIFRTSPLGISLEKDYYTSSSLAFKVNINDDSEIIEAKVRIKGLLEEPVTVTKDHPEAAFYGLNPNTEYNVIVTKIEYKDNYILLDEIDGIISKPCKTLKEAPKIQGALFEIDKRNSQYKLRVNSVEDVNKGIQGFRFEIYYPIATEEEGVITLSDKVLEIETTRERNSCWSNSE